MRSSSVGDTSNNSDKKYKNIFNGKKNNTTSRQSQNSQMVPIEIINEKSEVDESAEESKRHS